MRQPIDATDCELSFISSIEPIPMPFRDNLDNTIDHRKSSLIVDCICSTIKSGSPFSGGSHRIVR